MFTLVPIRWRTTHRQRKRGQGSDSGSGCASRRPLLFIILPQELLQPVRLNLGILNYKYSHTHSCLILVVSIVVMKKKPLRFLVCELWLSLLYNRHGNSIISSDSHIHSCALLMFKHINVSIFTLAYHVHRIIFSSKELLKGITAFSVCTQSVILYEGPTACQNKTQD